MTRINSLTWWSAGINLAGALAVGYGLWHSAPGTAPWVAAVVVAGLLAWVVRTLLAARLGARVEAVTAGVPTQSGTGSRAVAAGLLTVMVLAGGVTAIPTQGLGVALVIVAVLVVTSDPETPLPVWGGVAIAGVLGIVIGALLTAAGAAGPARASVLGLLAALTAPVFAVVAGSGRRAQHVLAAERERAGAEALRAQATADRVAIARDLHDVLAHSLGGLVVQLDAAEALLDAGDAGSAVVRVTAARQLAVEGLREAREAVRALRGPLDGAAAAGSASTPAMVDAAELTARIEALIAAHEGIGQACASASRAELFVTGAARPVPDALAEALVRAVQEGLSNARKHAPGSVVRVALIWQPDRVECIVENPVSAASRGDVSRTELAASGGGYGLPGVRERVAALGGTVQAGAVPSRGSGTGSGTGAETGSGGGSALEGRFVLRVEAAA